MSKVNREIEVLDVSVKVTRLQEADFISLTDIARHRDSERGDYIIQNWMRNRNTIGFLGIWEQLNNPAFNSIEFDGIRNRAGLNSFSLTPKRWISQTGAVGVVAKARHCECPAGGRDCASARHPTSCVGRGFGSASID